MGLFNGEDYEVSYYKTDLNVKEFNQDVERKLSNHVAYDCEKTLYNSGLFLKRRLRSWRALFSPVLELIFSQRENYALIFIRFYRSRKRAYLNYISSGFLLTVQLILLVSGKYYFLEPTFWGIIIVLLVLEIISAVIYRLEKKKINPVLNEIEAYSAKIKRQEYQRLLGD